MPLSAADLAAKLTDLLKRHSQPIHQLEILDQLDDSERSHVFAFRLNGIHHIAKLYRIHANFVRDLRYRRRAGVAPPVLLASPAAANPFATDLIITIVPPGISFNSSHLKPWVATALGDRLLELHHQTRARRLTVPGLRRALADASSGALQAASAAGPSAVTSTNAVITSMNQFLTTHGHLLCVPATLIHNDVWWDNTIVTQNSVYLIDWEWLHTGDPLEDLAYARIMLRFRPVHNRTRHFWLTPPDEPAADRFFELIVDRYQREFGDSAIPERLRFYLALQTLRWLSDYAAGVTGNFPELLSYWLEYLPIWWQYGLNPPPAPPAKPPKTR